MATPTYTQATTLTAQTAIRDALLASLTTFGSVVQGVPTSSPDRGLVEQEAAQLYLEQQIRVGIAQSISATSAINAGTTWVDAAASWFQVANGQGGVGRIPAQAAIWIFGLIIPASAAPLTLSPGQIVQVQALDANHSVYNCTIVTPIVLNSSSSYKASISAVARIAGSAANVTPGQITSVITGPAGLGIDGTVTQVLALAGADQETDTALVARCLGKWGTLGAGWTSLAFNYLIPLLSPTVTRWYVTDSNPLGPGTTQVSLADAAGPATVSEVASVQFGLAASNVRPLGSGQLVAIAATSYPNTITVTVKGDGSNPNLAANITSAISALTAQLPLGPLFVTLDLYVEICMGRAYSGTTAFQTLAGTYAELPFVLPGFGGAVGVVSFATSQGLATFIGPSLSADVVPVGQVFVATPVVTVT